MPKRSRNRAFQENSIEKKSNLVMTQNSDEFPIVTILAWSQKCRYTESQLYVICTAYWCDDTNESEVLLFYVF